MITQVPQIVAMAGEGVESCIELMKHRVFFLVVLGDLLLSDEEFVSYPFSESDRCFHE